MSRFWYKILKWKFYIVKSNFSLTHAHLLLLAPYRPPPPNYKATTHVPQRHNLKWNAYSHQWLIRSMPCTSPISQTTFIKLHLTPMTTHSNPEAIAILVIPQEDWYNKKHPHMGPHNETYVLAHLDPHTLTHSPKPYFPSTWLVLSPTSSSSSFAYL